MTNEKLRTLAQEVKHWDLCDDPSCAELEMMNEENGRLRREIATWKAENKRLRTTVFTDNSATVVAAQAEIERLRGALEDIEIATSCSYSKRVARAALEDFYKQTPEQDAEDQAAYEAHTKGDI